MSDNKIPDFFIPYNYSRGGYFISCNTSFYKTKSNNDRKNLSKDFKNIHNGMIISDVENETIRTDGGIIHIIKPSDETQYFIVPSHCSNEFYSDIYKCYIFMVEQSGNILYTGRDIPYYSISNHEFTKIINNKLIIDEFIEKHTTV